jgi:tryptophan 2,3-dioxygenase
MQFELASGKNHATGKESYLLEEFERKYKRPIPHGVQSINIWQKFQATTRWRPEKS